MTGCGAVRTALGVYVLGAIDPAERSRVDGHLASCPDCRDELAALAGLPALLGRVDQGQIDEAAEPGPGVLAGLLERAAAERRRPWHRRRHRRRPAGGWTLPALAAAALMIIGLVVGGVTGRQVAGTPRAVPSPPSATGSAAPGETWAATDASTHVTASVVLRRETWGTRAEISVGGVPEGARCRWYVVTRTGERELLGSWYVPYAAGRGQYGATTMYPRDQIASFQVDAVGGGHLVTIRA
ncbi:zf-HC2 domain-containing protein [Actinomadura harenae]|uniref:Zf-HC2 domain-containing protein n=1 Tax=Actinomadura harenae TaxID=2483351 RepID=A0A3M2LM46_9ACTN|nr:zf-HC2 domain-containing protein [Actinomadura harenae]RMI38511.1 zf-HC2 domain-containing protein [Actinomadura harenae]